MTSISWTVLRRGAIGLLTLGASIAVNAQTVPYDPNCNPATLTEDQKFNQEVCASHAGCRFFVMAPINAGCKAVNFIRNLGKSDPAIDNSVLIDGATYDLPRPTKFQQLVSDVKVAVHSALGTGAKRDVVQTDDGRIAYYEGGHITGGSGTGAMIYSDGTMARGTFDAKYKLSGTGELITPDGKVRAGEFKDNRLAGPGFVSEKDGDRTVLIEGTFDGDTPVGEVIRNYADGSRVRELWENGKMVARGERAPKGKVPPPIRGPEMKLASGASSSDGEGWFLVKEGKASKMWELRCRGRAGVLKVSPDRPTMPSCKELVQEAQSAPASTPPPTAALSNIWRRSDGEASLQIFIRPDELEVQELDSQTKTPKIGRKVPRVGGGTYREFQFNTNELVWRLVNENTLEVTGLDHHSGQRWQYIFHREK